MVVKTEGYQTSLFDHAASMAIDRDLPGCGRVALDDTAWIDLVPGWVRGADRLFAVLLQSIP